MKEVLDLIIKNIPADKVTSTRLFHGRGKMISGFEFLSIDYFHPTILITLFKKVPADLPADLLEALSLEISALPLKIENILVQHRYTVRPTLEAIKGSVPNDTKAFECGLNYKIKFDGSQNIGFFLDMAVGRRKLLDEANGKRVLNLFSYTCSLSVAAVKGGASEVINVDMSKGSLKIGEANHHLNGLELKKAKFLSYDILSSWNNIIRRGPFDLVIIDPPTNQAESFKVLRDYPKIIKRLDAMVAPGAQVWACLNSPHLGADFIKGLFSDHASSFNYLETLYGSFQSMESNPEDGLKLVIFTKRLL